MNIQTLSLSYRILLRHAKKLPSSQVNSSAVQHLVAQFQQHRHEPDAKKAAALRHTAHSYATLIASITELTSLRALDFGEKLDPRDKIRLTASRVGLSVPRFSDEGFSDGTPK